MKTRILSLASGLLLLEFSAYAASVNFGAGANHFTMDFVEIGDPGNAADSQDGDDGNAGVQNFGAVGATFYMGTYEVSRDMVTKANAAGGLGITLYDMTPYGGNGVDRPATGITWFEAATFVNWLNTSHGLNAAYKFDTVGGTFSLWEAGDAGFDASNPYRNSLANYFLPNVDEWYKAAYYDPASDTYFDFPTGSDTAPTAVASGTLSGTAVYMDVATAPADIDNAGGLSPFGTMAQGGNVTEWQETARDLLNDDPAESRGQRGGTWNFEASGMQQWRMGGGTPSGENFNEGFRVAAIEPIPEPSRALLSLLGLGVVLMSRRRH